MNNKHVLFEIFLHVLLVWGYFVFHTGISKSKKKNQRHKYGEKHKSVKNG